MAECLSNSDLNAWTKGHVLLAGDRQRIDAHLKDCPRCRREVEQRGGGAEPGSSAFAAGSSERTLDSGSSAGQGDWGTADRSPTMSTGGDPQHAIDNYELQDLLGEGGQARVFKAFQKQLGVHHAVKLLKKPTGPRRQEIEQRFKREAAAAAKLDHPNIVQPFAFGKTEDSLYYVMALVEGRSLDEIVKGMGADKPHASESALKAAVPNATRATYYEQVASWVADIAEALQYGHDLGVIHRDIKPGNVMIDSRCRPMLMDFGLAKDLFGGEDLTMPGAPTGTPSYMSPEQARGDELDGRTDVYSLGATLYVLLTYQRPFQSDNYQQVIERVKTIEPTSPGSLVADVPPDLEEICLKAMHKDHEQRYQTCTAFAQALGNWLEGRSSGRTGQGHAEEAVPAPLPPKRGDGLMRKLAVPLAVLVIVLGAAAAFKLNLFPPPGNSNSNSNGNGNGNSNSSRVPLPPKCWRDEPTVAIVIYEQLEKDKGALPVMNGTCRTGIEERLIGSTFKVVSAPVPDAIFMRNGTDIRNAAIFDHTKDRQLFLENLREEGQADLFVWGLAEGNYSKPRKNPPGWHNWKPTIQVIVENVHTGAVWHSMTYRSPEPNHIVNTPSGDTFEVGKFEDQEMLQAAADGIAEAIRKRWTPQQIPCPE